MATYKSIVEQFFFKRSFASCKLIELPHRVTSVTPEFQTDRFINYLRIKESPDLLIYNTSAVEGDITLGIIFKHSVRINSPKELLKIAFSREGHYSVKVIFKSTTYAIVRNSLFVYRENYTEPIPVLLASRDNVGRGLVVITDSLGFVHPTLQNTIMGDLLPVVASCHCKIRLMNNIAGLKWFIHSDTDPHTHRVLTPDTGFMIAKYLERQNGGMD